jgi:hypothetical protein
MISIFIPASRIDEVHFEYRNEFTKVLYDPNYGRNSRLLDAGNILLSPVPLVDYKPRPTPSKTSNKRKRDYNTDNEDTTDDDEMTVLHIALEEAAQRKRILKAKSPVAALPGGKSPEYSPSSPSYTPPASQADVLLCPSPPRKSSAAAKKKLFPPLL